MRQAAWGGLTTLGTVILVAYGLLFIAAVTAGGYEAGWGVLGAVLLEVVVVPIGLLMCVGGAVGMRAHRTKGPEGR